MKTKIKGSHKKKPKPNLNGPNSPTPKRSVKDSEVGEDDQRQITNTDSEVKEIQTQMK